MTFDSPAMLFGLIVLLGVVAVGLTIWLLRYAMRGKQAQRPEANGAAETKAVSAEAHHPAEVKKVASKVPEAPPAAPASAPVVAQPPDVPSVAPASTPPVAQPPATPPDTPAVPPASAAPARQPVSKPGDTLLMRVWRDREGFLVVEASGQRYRRLFDIRDGDRGRHVLEIIHRLDAFAKGNVSQISPPPASEEPSVPPEAVIEERSHALVEKFQQPETLAPKKTLLTADPVPFRRANEAQMSSITLNLAEEIDSFLQIRVEASSEFKGRHLRVANALDGGLRFEVDGARYGALDEIPEPSVQRIIKAAIADWEAKR